MRAKIAKLFGHPAFRAQPVAVAWRGAALLAHVALGREPALRLTRHGERLRVPADLRYTTVTTCLLRDWAEPELHELDLFVRPGDTFLDVGANIGLFTLKAARLVGVDGRVVAAEPGTVSADRLVQNLALNSFANVTLVHDALSDRIGRAGLHHIDMGGDPQAFSLLADGTGAAAETVATTTLDALAESMGLVRLDCVKLDVEGAEPMVVAGGLKALGRFRPIVIFEVNSPPALRSANPAEAGEMLVGLGYHLFGLSGRALVPLAQQPGTHGNVVAVHPEGRQPLAGSD